MKIKNIFIVLAKEKTRKKTHKISSIHRLNISSGLPFSLDIARHWLHPYFLLFLLYLVEYF